MPTPPEPEHEHGVDGHYNFESTCPYCGRENEALTALDGSEGPEPGALNLCPYCARWSTFTELLTLRKLTPDELRWVASQTHLLRITAQAKASPMYVGEPD